MLSNYLIAATDLAVWIISILYSLMTIKYCCRTCKYLQIFDHDSFKGPSTHKKLGQHDIDREKFENLTAHVTYNVVTWRQIHTGPQRKLMSDNLLLTERLFAKQKSWKPFHGMLKDKIQKNQYRGSVLTVFKFLNSASYKIQLVDFSILY